MFFSRLFCFFVLLVKIVPVTGIRIDFTLLLVKTNTLRWIMANDAANGGAARKDPGHENSRSSVRPRIPSKSVNGNKGFPLRFLIHNPALFPMSHKISPKKPECKFFSGFFRSVRIPSEYNLLQPAATCCRARSHAHIPIRKTSGTARGEGGYSVSASGESGFACSVFCRGFAKILQFKMFRNMIKEIGERPRRQRRRVWEEVGESVGKTLSGKVRKSRRFGRDGFRERR